jgi:hypothetical protein
MSIAEIRRMADLGSGKVLTRPGGTLRRETNSRRVQGSSASVAERPVAEREGARSSICDPSQSPINALVRDYTGSAEFEQTLARSTQTEYRRMLTTAEDMFGDMPIAGLDDARVRGDFLDLA